MRERVGMMTLCRPRRRGRFRRYDAVRQPGPSRRSKQRAKSVSCRRALGEAAGRPDVGPGDRRRYRPRWHLFVADRANNRIQIFDQDGNFLGEWKQFGRPSGVDIRDDILYATDGQSSDKVNAPFRQGIRIGSVKDGKVTAFITPPGSEPNPEMAESVTVDKDGHVFGGFTEFDRPEGIRQELSASGRARRKAGSGCSRLTPPVCMRRRRRRVRL